MSRRRTVPGRLSLITGGVLLIALIAVYPASALGTGWIITTQNHIMLVSPGSQGQGGGSYTAISSDGRYVAFESFADDLVPGHVADSWDALVSDIGTSQVQRVSMTSSGKSVYNPGDYTSPPAMTGSGRFVAFMSRASNLVSGDDNAMPDIFLRDRAAKTTRLITVALDRTPGNGPSFTPVVSADGRYVAFQSMASDLVANDTNDAMDVFVRDMAAGTTQRVSITDSGEQGSSPYEFPVSSIAISGDGRYVAFAYENLPYGVLADPGSYIYLRDRQSNTTRMVAPGTQPAFSTSGQYLVFLSDYPLTEDDQNNLVDVYLFDRQASAFERITALDGPEPASRVILSPPDVSDDGRYVVYESNDTFAAGSPEGPHIFLRDRQSGATTQVDRSFDGSQTIGEAHNPTISDDGSAVAFNSTAANLVPDDTNNAMDVFVYHPPAPSEVVQDQHYFIPMLYSP